MTDLQKIIEEKLIKSLNPHQMSVINESHKHVGHAGDDGSGETHWRIIVESQCFRDLSRLEKCRMVHEILKDELKSRIHALNLDLKDTPS